MRFSRTALASAAALLFAGALHATSYVVPPDRVLIEKADAIVIARAIHSHVEDSSKRGIETITVFAVEEVLKGRPALADGVRVRVPGGAIEEDDGTTRAKLIVGAPRFVDGERILLFLTRATEGHHIPTDFALGFFGFATDDLGHRVLVRAATEIVGWSLDGSVHREPRREAVNFLRYIRDVVRRQPAEENYEIDARPIVGDSPSVEKTETRGAETLACTGCTVTQYTSTFGGAEGGTGFRWNVFPTAVNWNRGNNASNGGNNGSDNISAGFSLWNDDTQSNTNFVLASANSNTNGVLAAADGVNNVKFEEDFSGLGQGPYSCAGGGLLGITGVQGNSGTSQVAGETFNNLTEVDISMNAGVNACIGTANLSLQKFNTALAHEIGHALGFRHTEKNRSDTSTCASGSNYDCETSAVMTSTVVAHSVLAAWDVRAVRALYPSSALPAPTNVAASTTPGSTTVTISWTGSAGAVSGSTVYQVHRSTNNSTFTQVCTATHPTVTCNDAGAGAGNAYVYKVRANADGAFSAIDLATTTNFTDATLQAGTTVVKDEHVTELRTMIDKLRALTGMGGGTYSAVASGTVIQKAHITEMRSALDAGRASLVTAGCSACGVLSYTDSTINIGSTPVKAVHFTELRNGLN